MRVEFRREVPSRGPPPDLSISISNSPSLSRPLALRRLGLALGKQGREGQDEEDELGANVEVHLLLHHHPGLLDAVHPVQVHAGGEEGEQRPRELCLASLYWKKNRAWIPTRIWTMA